MQQPNAAKWGAIGAMLGVLCVLFLVAPKAATDFALVILLCMIGFGFQKGAFNLKGVVK